MASFHLAVKAIGRSAGRSATAAAAYRAGVEITDERTGLVHDYTRKQGVEHSELMLPTDAPEWAADRERLWNAAELSETRKNATVAREYEIALPVELSADERRELALGLAREISERHGVAVDVRSEEHTSELQSLMRISYAVFCLQKKTRNNSENMSPACATRKNHAQRRQKSQAR